MTKTNATTRILATVTVLAIATAAWLAFAPSQVGGRMSYVVTEGDSMQPRFDGGDLVGVRRAPSYESGDIVAYRSRSLGRVVLHRIVRTQGDGYVLKGDNNSWLDSDRPNQSDILGKELFTIPGAGKVLGWIGGKGRIALVVVIGVLAIAAAPLTRRRNDRSRPNGVPAVLRRLPSAALRRIPSGALRGRRLWLAGAGAGVSAVLLLLSFLLPPGRSADPNPKFRQDGRFEYSATVAKNVVYPNGRLSTGDPVYVRLVDELDISFSYALTSDASTELSGTAALSAELGDATGWSRRIKLSPPAPFTGNEMRLNGRLDLASMKKLVERVQQETGIFTSTFTLAVVPEVAVEGRLAGSPLQTTFSPRLDFQFDTLHLRIPPAQEGSADPTRPSQQGQVEAAGTVDAPALLGMPVAVLRWLALMALSMCVAAFVMPRRAPGDHDPGTQSVPGRHAHLVVPVTSVDRAGRTLVEVESFEALAALAESSQGPILSTSRAGRERYLFDRDGILYSFRVPVERNGRSARKPSTRNGKGNRAAKQDPKRSNVRAKKTSTSPRKVGAAGRNSTARSAGARSKPKAPTEGNGVKRARRKT